MEQQLQLFRVYQLDLEGIKTYPFAFRGIEVMRKAGYQQPPAADYRLVYDGGIHCAKDAEPKEVVERIYIRCTTILQLCFGTDGIWPTRKAPLSLSNRKSNERPLNTRIWCAIALTCSAH